MNHFSSRERIVRRALVLVALAILAGCGGGGGGGGAAGAAAADAAAIVDTAAPAGDGEKLNPTYSYDGQAFLFRPSRIAFNSTGFQGHTPNCALLSGSLPAGLTLSSDCSIAGTPLQSGSFQLMLRVGASGVSNQQIWNPIIEVVGPTLLYSFPSAADGGTVLSLRPSDRGWTPLPGDVVTYSVAGSLPPGLSLDPATGLVSGMLTTTGTYPFKLSVTTSEGGLSATQADPFERMLVVGTPTLSYLDCPAWAGLPYDCKLRVPPSGSNDRFSSTSLPPGLAIDPVTGEISGIPAQPTQYPTTVQVQLTATDSKGASFGTTQATSIHVQSPVYIRYPSDLAALTARRGQPYSVAPTLINNAGVDLGGMSFRYSLSRGSMPLPGGFTLDAATGAISGTPTTFVSVSVLLDVTETINGASFVDQVPVLIAVQN